MGQRVNPEQVGARRSGTKEDQDQSHQHHTTTVNKRKKRWLRFETELVLINLINLLPMDVDGHDHGLRTLIGAHDYMLRV